MGKEIVKRKSLWMRWVSFQKIRDTLFIIKEHNGRLTAKDLKEICIEHDIFIRRDKAPFSNTTAYHYRKIMEHLQIVKLQHGRYYVNIEKPQIVQILGMEHWKKDLSKEEKVLFSSIVVTNKDCQKYFFNVFMLSNIANYGLDAFIEKGAPVVIKASEEHSGNGKSIKRIVVLSNKMQRRKLIIDNRDKMNGILWGIRLWALNELGIIDEIFLFDKSLTVYPIYPEGTVKFFQIIDPLIDSLKLKGEWISIAVPELTYEWAIKLKISTKEFHKAILGLYRQFKDLMVLIPTAETFITVMTPFPARDEAFFKGFFRDEKGSFISHIRIHKDLILAYDQLKRRNYNGNKSI